MNGFQLRSLSRSLAYSMLALLTVFAFLTLSAQHSMALPENVQTEPGPPLPTQPDGSSSVRNPAANLAPHIFAIPSLDGTELYIQADKMPLATSVFFANVSVGPGHEKDAWSMTYTTTQNALTATALGFTPQESVYGSMNITGTSSGVFYSTNELEFNRAYLPMSDEMLTEWSPDGAVELRILPNTITNDTYLLMMSSFAPPAAAAPDSVLVSPSYTVRLADPVAQTASPVLMRMYLDGLPILSSDWHSLTISRWDVNRGRWVEETTHLNAESGYLWAQVNRLAEYAIIKANSWLDEFEDLSGADLRRSQSIELASINGDRGVTLAAGALAGSITSQPIKLGPSGAGSVTVSFAGLAEGATARLQVDLLGESGAIVADNVQNGDTFFVDPKVHSVLRLRATLERTSGAAAPILHRWRLDQAPAQNLFLPMTAR